MSDEQPTPAPHDGLLRTSTEILGALMEAATRGESFWLAGRLYRTEPRPDDERLPR